MQLSNLSSFDQVILSKAKVSDEKLAVLRDGVDAGSYSVDMLLHVQGEVTVGDDYETTPTVSIPVKETLALFIARAGITREKSIALLRECVTDAILKGKAGAAGELAAMLPQVAETLDKVQSEVLDKLPKSSRKGPVSMRKVKVTKVVTQAAPIAPETISVPAA